MSQLCVYLPVRRMWAHNPLGSISSMRSLTRSHISRPERTQLGSVHGKEMVNRVPLSHHEYIQVQADDDTYTRVLLFRVLCALAISGYQE